MPLIYLHDNLKHLCLANLQLDDILNLSLSLFNIFFTFPSFSLLFLVSFLFWTCSFSEANTETLYLSHVQSPPAPVGPLRSSLLSLEVILRCSIHSYSGAKTLLSVYSVGLEPMRTRAWLYRCVPDILYR